MRNSPAYEEPMELVQHIPKTELARNTRGVINQVLRGQTIVVEGHGVVV